MHLKVVTPTSEKLSVDVASVTIPGGMGEVTILPGHTSLMSTLEVGVLSWVEAWEGASVNVHGASPPSGVGSRQALGGKGSRQMAVNRGFFEVLDDEVTVLTETAEMGNEVDVQRARESLKRANERLERSWKDPSIDVARAEYAARRALARLAAAGYHA